MQVTPWNLGKLAGLLALLAGVACTNELAGSLTGTLRDASGATWTVTPDECSSGERQGFFGVDLRGGGKDDAIVRAIQDPVQGPLLRVNVPGTDKALTLQPGPGCAHFEVQVERQNSRINNISNVRGRVRVACDTPELALDADITFANCH
jgi:hypothetical protein